MTDSFLATDTHPLLWYIGGAHKRLSKRVLSAFNSAKTGNGAFIWIPQAVIWEISILIKKANRLVLKASLEEIVRENFYSKNIFVADQQTEDILQAHTLSFNKDPFDALIVGTALRMQVPLITADNEIINAQSCPIFWD